MPVFQDQSASNNAAAPTTLAVSITPTAKAPRLLFGAAWRGLVTVSSIVASSANMPAQALRLLTQTTGANNIKSAAYELPRPAPAESITITITFSGATDGLIIGASTFGGVDGDNPYIETNSTNGGSGNPSLAVAGRLGGMVFDVASCDRGSLTVGSGQTQLWNSNDGGNGDVFGAASVEAGATSVTMSWTNGSTNGWALSVVSLRPSDQGRAEDPIWADADDDGWLVELTQTKGWFSPDISIRGWFDEDFLVNVSGTNTPVNLTVTSVSVVTASDTVQFARAFAVTSLSVVSVTKNISKLFAATALAVVSVTKNIKPNNFVATALSVATFSALLSHNVSVAITSLSVVTPSWKINFARAFAATSVAVVTFTKNIGKTFAATSAALTSVAKNIGKPIAATALAIVSMFRNVDHAVSAPITSVSVVTESETFQSGGPGPSPALERWRWIASPVRNLQWFKGFYK